MSEILYEVKIADATGHTVAQMTKPEIVAKATASQGTWVFVNDRLVSASRTRAAWTLEAADRVQADAGPCRRQGTGRSPLRSQTPAATASFR